MSKKVSDLYGRRGQCFLRARERGQKQAESLRDKSMRRMAMPRWERYYEYTPSACRTSRFLSTTECEPSMLRIQTKTLTFEKTVWGSMIM